jgi:(p)ppGpp synthase/HD superfamily hydrolase
MQDDKKWRTKFEHCHDSDRLLKKLLLLNEAQPKKDKIDILKTEKAIYYAKRHHGDQKRQSGEPYYFHPLERLKRLLHENGWSPVVSIGRSFFDATETRSILYRPRPVYALRLFHGKLMH